jgi:hypothetical protein
MKDILHFDDHVGNNPCPYQLCSISGCLNSLLSFGVPLHTSVVDEKKNGHHRSSSDGVMCMIGINIYGDSCFLSKWSWHVVWKFFNGVWVELFPIVVICNLENRVVTITGVHDETLASKHQGVPVVVPC